MQRIEKLLNEMTLEEKVAMVSGSGPWHTTGVERLGVPRMKLTDGPNGARGDGVSGASATCFPVGSALSAAWNIELIEEVGRALGVEAKSKGAQVLLGPTINIHRSPLGGRNFECYSEDPYLTARLVVSYVNGLQSQKVGATLKHYICNDSEYDRHTISSEVSERALREIYMPPFEYGVKEAGAWSVMSAYNRINGIFASSHQQLMNDVLKDEWGFEGFVVSDWGACLETVNNANGGLDLEMPGPARTMGRNLMEAVERGEVEEKIIDDKVRRLLRITILSGKMDRPEEAEEHAVDTPEVRALARRSAVEGMVLLKNDGVLPFEADSLKRVAVIGPNAEVGQIQGGGSSGVKPHYQVHPLEAMERRLGNQVALRHEKGCTTHKYIPAVDRSRLRAKDRDEPGLTLEYFENPDLSGEPAQVDLEKRSKISWFGAFASVVATGRFGARFSGVYTAPETGLYTFGLMSAGQSRMLLDGREIIDNWTEQTRGESFYAHGSTEKRAEVELQAGREYELVIEYKREQGVLIAGLQYGILPPVPSDLMERAVQAAQEADAVVLVAGTNGEWETEGNDRADMSLPGRQVELIQKVCAANPRTVVVLNAGSPIDMPWLDQAPAVLQSWFPGQEFGNALADVLFGDANPSGKMPTTVPVRLEDTPAFTTYPGENHRVLYGEDIFVGYRWYDKRDIAPRVPFGHGLSYTTFEYGPIKVEAQQKMGDTIKVQVEVSNTGSRAGQEVVQLYVRDVESRLVRPVKELKGFRKIALEPGEAKQVEFLLDERSLSYWDRSAMGWMAEPGEFELLVGSSSRDIRSTARFILDR
ncbi:MAG: beta-glucosidase [Proteobacteria bacterium]|nr:beta-glucosidase [Pseudomonadota bacterium]